MHYPARRTRYDFPRFEYGDARAMVFSMICWGSWANTQKNSPQMAL